MHVCITDYISNSLENYLIPVDWKLISLEVFILIIHNGNNSKHAPQGPEHHLPIGGPDLTATEILFATPSKKGNYLLQYKFECISS